MMTALVVGTHAEARDGSLAERVRRLSRQDRMVAIALRMSDHACYVLLAAAPSIN
jgi:response regulator RpfG family c-di-GMP phosphodiesterase